MSASLASFLFEALNFLLLAAGLSWLLFKPVRKALASERERFTQQQASLEQMRSEAAALKQEASERRQRLDIEVAERREKLLEAARRETTDQAREAKQAISDMKSELARERASMQEGLVHDLLPQVATVAAAALNELLTSLSSSNLDLMLCELACRQLAEHEIADSGVVTVLSAKPLTEEAQKLLQGSLDGPFEQREHPELLGGVRLIAEDFVIDASVRGICNRAEQRWTAALAARTGEPPDAS